MSTKDEQEVLAAARFLFEAIEKMASGQGLEAMGKAWHQKERVTSKHPSGDWAEGWDELYATWDAFAAIGRPDTAGSKIRDLKAYVYGDMAYTTCIFTASPAFGGESMACTDIFRRVDGAWKAIHHHADASPAMGAAAERIARESVSKS